jgi:hypothetical protein
MSDQQAERVPSIFFDMLRELNDGKSPRFVSLTNQAANALMSDVRGLFEHYKCAFEIHRECPFHHCNECDRWSNEDVDYTEFKCIAGRQVFSERDVNECVCGMRELYHCQVDAHLNRYYVSCGYCKRTAIYTKIGTEMSLSAAY